MEIWLACQCGGDAGRVGDIGYVHVVLWLAGWMTININSREQWCNNQKYERRYHQLLWRNWLARLTVNQEVGGSSPPRSAAFFSS
ncbi:hypothetical protein G6F32_013277 [Rhizopus arrhizus]|nr:hypothetical protein G6F32_013277 [Rhizopus arrhizus]